MSRRTSTNVQQPEDCDEPLQRVFCQFIMGKIAQLKRAMMNDDDENYTEIMETLNIVPKGDEKQLTGKFLMK